MTRQQELVLLILIMVTVFATGIAISGILQNLMTVFHVP